MYDALIKTLRETSADFGELDNVSVLLIEAADAIEELSKRVPKTPHGRLIDRDALRVYMLNEHYNFREVVSYSDIVETPTIIPAEEGE